LNEITKNDKVTAYYKFPQTSNYKTNYLNSMGILEDTHTLALLHSVLNTIGLCKENVEKTKSKV
jgi:hypothetical protein